MKLFILRIIIIIHIKNQTARSTIFILFRETPIDGVVDQNNSRKGLPFFAVAIFRFLLLAHSCIKIMYQRQPLLCFSFGKSMLVFYLLPIFFYMAMSWYSGVYDNNKHFEQRGRKDIAYERALKVYYVLQN